MNWLDITLLIILGAAAWKGFRRGFIIELAALAGLVLGIWAGIRLNHRVTEELGLVVKQEALAFLVTFIVVLVLVMLLGHALTKLIDIAQLGLPNKFAGIAFGAIRSAFTLSIALNLIMAYTNGATPPAEVRSASRFFAPLRSLAPMIIPAVEETKWVQRTKESVREAADELNR